MVIKSKRERREGADGLTAFERASKVQFIGTGTGRVICGPPSAEAWSRLEKQLRETSACAGCRDRNQPHMSGCPNGGSL